MNVRVPTRGLGRAALLVWLVLGHTGPAAAYVRTTTESGHAMRWPNTPLITVNLYTVSPPRYLDQATLVDAVTAAAATWSRPAIDCTDLEVSVQPFGDESAPVAYDSTNRITFRKETWHKIPCDPATELCGLYDQRAIALTSVFARKSDGRILDSDMELNAVNFDWADVVRDGADLPDTELQLHDLQNVVTHEIGHLIGLDHNCYDPAANPRGRPNDHEGNPAPNCDGAPVSIRAATMFNSAARRDVSKRDLTDDDIQAVCDTYPAGSTSEEDVTGGCAVVRDPVRGGRPRREFGSGLPIAMGTLGLLLGLRRRRPSR